MNSHTNLRERTVRRNSREPVVAEETRENPATLAGGRRRDETKVYAEALKRDGTSRGSMERRAKPVRGILHDSCPVPSSLGSARHWILDASGRGRKGVDNSGSMSLFPMDVWCATPPVVREPVRGGGMLTEKAPPWSRLDSFRWAITPSLPSALITFFTA